MRNTPREANFIDDTYSYVLSLRDTYSYVLFTSNYVSIVVVLSRVTMPQDVPLSVVVRLVSRSRRHCRSAPRSTTLTSRVA